MYCKVIKKFFNPSVTWHSTYNIWAGHYTLNGMERTHGLSDGKNISIERIEKKFNKYLIALWAGKSNVLL